jgi:hypothetical protein
VAVGALAVVLGWASLNFGNTRGVPTAIAGKNPDSRVPPGACSRFLADLKSDKSNDQVALDNGLPASVPVPPGITADPVYCFGADTEDGSSGEVLGFAVMDSNAGDVWLVVARDSHLEDADWQAILTDHGWQPAAKTAYGYTTRPGSGPTVDLWSQLKP